MPRTAFTFVAGATTAGAVILVVMALQGSFDPSESPASTAAPASAPPQATGASPGQDQSSAATADSDAPTPAVATNEQRPIAIEQAIEPNDDRAVLPDPAPVGQSLPIPVNSRELEIHFERLELAGTISPHAEINEEAWDSVWASTTENQFARFYTSQPELVAEYGIPAVYCRSTLCEIQVVARGATPANWLRLSGALFDQPWADQFGEGPIGEGYSTTVQGEVIVITQWVRRKDSETRTSQPTSAVI